MTILSGNLPLSLLSAAAAGHRKAKLGFIDALRGYAVLLVITSHAGMSVTELPYPIRKLTNFGWYGVQLFFLMSCVTLLLSWRSDEAKGTANLRFFWIRRLLRIAPMYYAAGLLFFVVMPPELGFDVQEALASALFVNSWHPILMPTVAHKWSVVPGGWSVGVEFTFYLIFPVFAALVGTWRRAVVVAVAGFAVAYVSTVVAEPLLLPSYGKTATEMFLFYWFPHQFPVFALGAVLYHALKATWDAPEGSVTRLLRCHGTWVAVGCIGACIAVASLPFPGRMPAPPLYLPRPYLASIIFMVLALALGNSKVNLLNNRWIRSFGRVSFSAYLLHFAVIHMLTRLPSVFDTSATGYRAILMFALLYLCTVPITHLLAIVTFNAIEQPMMEVGRTLIAKSSTRSVRQTLVARAT